MRRTSSAFLNAFIIVAMAVSQPSFGGLNRWTSHGPEGGSVTVIVTDPTAEAVAYAANPGGGIYKTENGGEQWKPINNGLLDRRVSALAMAHEDHRTLYAGTTRGKVFKTVDGGQQWVELTRVGSETVQFLAVLSSEIAVAATERGVLRTADGGATWQTSSLANPFTYFLTRSPAGVLFAGQFPSVYVSENRGESWSRMETAPPATAIAFGRDGSIYLSGTLGVDHSVDGGRTWQRVGTPAEGFRIGTKALHVSSNGRLYLATLTGSFYEYEGNRPVRVAGISGVKTIAESSAARLFVGSEVHGIFTRHESSTGWTQANRGFLNGATNDTAVAPFDPSLVYAATQDGTYKSSDYGESWLKVEAAQSYTVAVNPTATRNIFAGQDELKKSNDGGSTWSVVKPNLTHALAMAPSDPATMYAALTDGMSKSTDSGETWTSLTSAPFGYYSFYYGLTVTSMTVDPSESSTLYVAHEGGMHKSTDGGASWKQISSVASARDVETDPSDSSVIYAAFPPRGVWKSVDGGTSFFASGLSDQVVNALAIDPSSPFTVYAGTAGGDIYRSDDRGDTWFIFGDGLGGGAIREISVDDSGRYLYAATAAGTFEYEISEVQVDSLPADRLRLPRLLKELFPPGGGASVRSAFVLPIVGLTRGVFGSFFRTDMTLQNDGPAEQEVLVAWLAQGNPAGDVPFFRTKLSATGKGVYVPNVVKRLGMAGLGTLVVIAIDSAGNLDREASIGGSCRICSYSDARMPLRESIAGIRADLFGDHAAARAEGLRYDAMFRTNVGIANLDAEGRRFTVTAGGERHVEIFEVFVPPFSLIHTAIPRDDYGAMTLEVTATGSRGPWLFYGSSVNNATGASSTSVGIPQL